MKKTLLTSICAVAVGSAAFAQGVVSWSTILPTAMTAQTNAVAYSPLFGGATVSPAGTVGATATTANAYYYALLYNTAGTQQTTPTTLAGLSGWLSTGLTAVNNAASAGRLSNVNPTTAATVPWAQGTTYSIMLVGWSANLGSSWSTVLDELNNWNTAANTISGLAFFGESATGYITPNTSPASGATIWGSTANANGTPIFSPNTQLYELPVPEPTTMALVGLGGAAMLAFRRKNK